MKFYSLFLVITMVIMTHGAPAPQIGGLGNAMQPEVHATGLIPMITGTNVPESEEEIEAPIYDEHEVEKVRGLAKQAIEDGRNPDKFISTPDTLLLVGIGETTPAPAAVSTSPHPIFTLPNGIPTITNEHLITVTTPATTTITATISSVTTVKA
ncbi:hypothetical protein CAEBREN_00832 [Caenorhabditis brenneri]|uniref:Uncharacterized protein n=1 Tax=Caenorhabditis brenneri TaxID=135651 RepID=G0PAA3_CAEBE|nr:hypothetical protein CAEBREN_00832 [Caenorhabditis brenneri]